MIFTNNIEPVLFSAGGLSVHWYGLFFALGIVFTYVFLTRAFKRHGYPQEHLDSLAIYLFLGLLIGARLGHVFFYEAEYYLAGPLRILQIWNGGLASHGALIGLFAAYFIWLKVHKVKFTKYADLIVVPLGVTAAGVRFGNFFNSEIIGKPTDGDWGVIFRKLGETFPRHPVQLYEAVMCLAVFVVMYVMYKKYYRGMAEQAPMLRSEQAAGAKPKLFFLFLFLLMYFSGRFLLEFFKDLHGPLPADFPLSMGQVLSIVPVVVAAGWFGWRAVRCRG